MPLQAASGAASARAYRSPKAGPGTNETLISWSGTSTITDFFDTNLAAFKDGNTNQDNTAATNNNTSTKTVTRLGVDLGSAKYISGMKTWGANNRGYGSFGYTGTIDLVLKASNADPTTNSWAGTTIGTIAQFSNSAAANAKQTLGNANAVQYRYVWCEITGGSAIFAFMAELEFYEWL